jgi:pyrroline-5-carboxylate reductase
MSLSDTKLTDKKVAFIGCGNMATAIIGGLINSGCLASNIITSNPTNTKLEKLAELYSLKTTSNNQDAANFAEVIVLSVKPQKLTEVCKELSELDLSVKLLISVAAGYQTAQITKNINQKLSIIRSMPNTPALIGQGATGLFATENVSTEQKQTAEQIFKAVGKVSWVALESQMNIVTAISGSSPAYFFLMMQSMVEQAVAAGLPEKTALELVMQSASGAAQLAQVSHEESLLSLREAVTSPGGTTAAAINSFQASGFEVVIKKAVKASIDRGIELGKS